MRTFVDSAIEATVSVKRSRPGFPTHVGEFQTPVAHPTLRITFAVTLTAEDEDELPHAANHVRQAIETNPTLGERLTGREGLSTDFRDTEAPPFVVEVTATVDGWSRRPSLRRSASTA